MAKIFFWLVIVFLMFFVPNNVIGFYGDVIFMTTFRNKKSLTSNI
jgi:hypothetical protein